MGFSLYIDFFGNYNQTYGALAGVIVLILWLWLTSYLVLLGAEINYAAERARALVEQLPQGGCPARFG